MRGIDGCPLCSWVLQAIELGYPIIFACVFCCEFGCTSVTLTILAVVAFSLTHRLSSLPCRLVGADVSVPLVSPQVSSLSCDSGVGVATTLAHIPLGMTTLQLVALSASLPMVP